MHGGFVDVQIQLQYVRFLRGGDQPQPVLLTRPSPLEPDFAGCFRIAIAGPPKIRAVSKGLKQFRSGAPALRGSMAAQICNRIAEKLGVQVRGWPYNEKFLEAVHAQYRSGGRLRTN